MRVITRSVILSVASPGFIARGVVEELVLSEAEGTCGLPVNTAYFISNADPPPY
jgi:hypothetical protein